MRTRLIFGAAMLLLGAVMAIQPSITGAVTGTIEGKTLMYISIPFVALGAAVIANALRTIVFSAK